MIITDIPNHIRRQMSVLRGNQICLKQRKTTHAQNGSIEKYQGRLRASEILLNVNVLHSAHDSQELVLAEALLIKKLQLTINSQMEGKVRVLSILQSSY